MSAYYCHRCDQLKDGDWVDAVEDPKDKCEMCCLKCLDEEEYEEEMK